MNMKLKKVKKVQILIPQFQKQDENEVGEFQEHDDNEDRLEYNAGTDEDSDWKEEEEFHETNLPAIHLVFYGYFYEAKVLTSSHDKWLLVHVQQREQFNSHLLKREPWSNATVQEQLSSHFVFWETSHEDIEGQKVCCFYKVTTLPVIMVIDPITGAKMYVCHEMKQPENLLEDLMRFYDRSPKQHLAESLQRKNDHASSHQIVENEVAQPKENSSAVITKPGYPPLPEEPTDEKLICRVGICLPNSQRVRRSFLKTDPTKLLWSFCSTLLEEEESQSFHFIVPNSPKLFYDNDATFEEAALSNTLLRLGVERVN
ncbi:plant UBX domain-containing protein 7-like [Phalaenopsis equestris]|uniref:plant UBX domain-containing protein 7-like n=1 Tax=Phalaenopsis equestris TaxID=78828 RepID=UPI0009E5064B|nr:plant UBX domain-containing protein 7-like [Phalaenopsis equestris]